MRRCSWLWDLTFSECQNYDLLVYDMCSLVDMYQHLGQTFCLNLQGTVKMAALVPPKCSYLPSKLHGTISQKTWWARLTLFWNVNWSIVFKICILISWCQYHILLKGMFLCKPDILNASILIVSNNFYSSISLQKEQQGK